MNYVSNLSRAGAVVFRSYSPVVFLAMAFVFLMAGCDSAPLSTEDLSEQSGALVQNQSNPTAGQASSQSKGKTSLGSAAVAPSGASSATFTGNPNTTLAAQAFGGGQGSPLTTNSSTSVAVFAPKVCCLLPDGFAEFMLAKPCKLSGGLAVSKKECLDVQVSLCCELPNGTLSFMLNTECKDLAGSVAPIADCQEVEKACCQFDDGTFGFTLPGDCATIVPDALCEGDETVCCKHPILGPTQMSSFICLDSGGSILPDDQCEEESVCCLLDDGTFAITLASDCVNIVSDALCVEAEEVCCQFDDGTVGITLASDCANIVPDALCESDEPVCCEHPVLGLMMMSSIKCLLAGGVILPNDLCEPVEDICCEHPQLGYVNMPSAQCISDGGGVVSDIHCNPEPIDVCCIAPYGSQGIAGPFWTTNVNCLALGGTIVADYLCEEPPEVVCCTDVNLGTFTTTLDNCDDLGGTAQPLALCEEVCCDHPTLGIINITIAECHAANGGILPDEECNPEEICCIDLNGNALLLTVDECEEIGGLFAPMASCEDGCEVDIDKEMSLIVTDVDALQNFPLEDVLAQLITLGNVTTSQNSTDLFQRWWSTQRKRITGDSALVTFCDDPNPDFNGFGIECPRPESMLENEAPSTHLPVALVNRFDLAPTNGAHCGEYRIVYALDLGLGLGRNFIIFEAVLPNPNPQCGLAGCKEVVEFWADLTEEPDSAVRAAQLQDFYFNGLPGFDPVVQPQNYGDVPPGTPTGQVRTNQFMGAAWNLREFKVERNCDVLSCSLFFRQTSVKGNPSPTLWDGSDASYNSAFIAQLALQMPIVENINRLGMETAEQYNTGESFSQPPFPASDNFASYNATGQLATDIANAIPGTSNLTVADISARAQTQTCGGCHQTSTNANLGTQSGGAPLMWPAQVPAFVHIDEFSVLSLALAMPGGFMDQRKQILEDFLVLTCDEPCLTDPIVVATDGSLMTSQEAAEVQDEAKIIAPTKSDPLQNTLSGRETH